MGEDSSRYDRLHSLFAEASELPPAARGAFVREVEDGELRRELSELLKSAEPSNTPAILGEERLAEHRRLLEQIALEPELEDAAASESTVTQVAGYRILRKIAEGGMGVVYLAEQENPKRSVALKLVHPGRSTPERLLRFRREAQILGRLQHPGIAQIFEAGSFDLGRGEQPYYAMEFVEGVNLETYAERAGLDIRGKLRLIAQLCDAIHHAHTAGVIHRDLKPDNVLVDESGRVKVLDFGVALAADAEHLLSTMVTEEGQILGTLGFMAPEQITGDLDATTPRTDVYSLGVMTWLLLIGALPLDPAGMSLTAGIKMLSEREARPIGEYSKGLRGDVETIVGKALEKEPARRYESAEAFASDLRRYLENRPIAARPPSRWYRARKYARRHRGLVASIAALLLGLVGTGVFAVLARQQERLATALEIQQKEGLYYAEMQLASNVAGDLTSAPRVRELVGHWVPKQGERDLRGFEWHLLAAMSAETEEVIECDEGVLVAKWHPTKDLFVTGERPARLYDVERGNFVRDFPTTHRSEDIAWSPTGDRVVFCSPALVQGFDSETGEEWFEFENTHMSDGVSFAPDGSFVLLADGDGTFRKVDRDSQKARVVHAHPDHMGGPGMMSLSPSGDRVLIFARGQVEARIVDTESWEILVRILFLGAGNTLTSSAWSPDGTKIVMGGAGGGIGIWSAEDGELLRPLHAHTQFVTEVSWSPDGRRLLSASRDSSVLIWDPEHGRVLDRLRGHTLIAEYASWNKSGDRIVSASGDGTIRIWPANRPTAHWIEWHNADSFFPLPQGSWSRDGLLFAANREENTELKRHEGARFRTHTVLEGRRPAWSRNGLVATYSPDGVQVYRGSTGAKQAEIPLGRKLDWWTRLAWNPRQTSLLAITDNRDLWLVDLQETGSSNPVLKEAPHADLEGLVRSLSWSPDGNTLLACKQFRSVFWDVETKTAREGPSYPKIRIQDGDWSPNGDLIALTLEDLSVRLLEWNPETGAWSEKHALRGHLDQIHNAAWNPDGSRLASSSADGTVKLWEPTSGRLAASLNSPAGLHDVCWSPDGRTLTAMDFSGNIVVWSLHIDDSLTREEVAGE